MKPWKELDLTQGKDSAFLEGMKISPKHAEGPTNVQGFCYQHMLCLEELIHFKNSTNARGCGLDE